MNKPSRNEPSPSEWKALRHVWAHGPCSARDVCDALASVEGWTDSTIKTLLRRLVEKGQLVTKSAEGGQLYSAKKSPKRALFDAGERLLERARQDTVAPLLAHLVKHSELSSDELAELRNLVEAEQRRRSS